MFKSVVWVRIAPRRARCTRKPAIPAMTIESRMARMTLPLLSQLTMVAPPTANEAPSSSKTSDAVVLTGVPKAE